MAKRKTKPAVTGDGKPKGRKGLASMDPAKVRQITSMGGKQSQRSGKGNKFTSAQARVAGKKGGETVAGDRAHMAAIGRKGGLARADQVEAAKRARYLTDLS